MKLKSLNVLNEIAREVYIVVHPLLGASESRKTVGSGFGGDETKLIDYVAEDAIIQYLKRNHYSCVFIGEERGVQQIGEEPVFYLIADALDGTTNAVRGINVASTSLAISPRDRLADLEAAVVMDLSNCGIYEDERGKGARYNGEKIEPPETVVLRDLVMSVDISQTPEIVEKIVPLMKIVRSVRSLESAALEICYVSSGLLEAYIDICAKLRTLDIAAGILILREAGGIFLQLGRKRFQDMSLMELNRFSVIAASNEKICDKVASVIGFS